MGKSNAKSYFSKNIKTKNPVPDNNIFKFPNIRNYNNNLAALGKRYPEIASMLIGLKTEPNYKLISTGKTPNLFCIKQNMYYYDKTDPLLDVKNQTESLQIKNAKLAVFLGFGLGYMVKYFIEKMANMQKTDQILIIEKDPEIFKLALSLEDISPLILNPHVTLVVGIKEEDLFSVFVEYFKASLRIAYLKTIQSIYHTSALVLHKEYYLNALKKIREGGIFALKFYGNDPKDSLIGVENMLDNVGEIVKNSGIDLLYNKFKGKPAIIASTGPSLNKNKHLLKGLEDKALIIAPDASLKPLLETGVKPHLITALERIEMTVKLVQGFTEEEVQDIYYAATPVVKKEAYEAYPGPRIIVYRNFDHFKWLGIERGILDIKHSSGNMAFKIADALGCDPIILIGQDLAYSREGKTHASGTTLGEVQGNNDGRIRKFEVMGNDGETILTNETWNEFRQGYELDIKEYTGKCINSTEGGAFIQGTEVMPFAEAISLYIKDSFAPLNLIKETLSHFTLDQTKSDIAKVKQIIEETLNDLKDMKEDCSMGIKTIQDNMALLESFLVGDNKDGKGDITIVSKVEKEVFNYKNRITSKRKTMQLFLMHIIQSFNVKFEMDIQTVYGKYEHFSMVKTEIVLSQRKWFTIMQDIISICINLLEQTMEKLTKINLD